MKQRGRGMKGMWVLPEERRKELMAAGKRIEEICEEFELTPMELLWVVVGLVCTKFHVFAKRFEGKVS